MQELRQRQRGLVANIQMLVLTACGGGGGSAPIPPFWVQSDLVVADFNADGRLDVAVATTLTNGPRPQQGYVDAYLHSDAEGINAPIGYPVGSNPWGVVAGDIDVDGTLDLLVASPRERGATNTNGTAPCHNRPALSGEFYRFPSRGRPVGKAARSTTEWLDQAKESRFGNLD